MRAPERLEALIELGVIQEVIRPLLSGKEADVYLVWANEERRVAKVYKEATQRSFKHRAEYTEGRRVRNTRQQRAMDKRSKYGRAQIEEAWRNAEVDAIYRLYAAGVAVPTPHDFVEGVLVMQLVCDDQGEPAPRLVDVHLEPEEARPLFHTMLEQVVRMLLAGVVHGDLSDFNVLLAADGPVVIDFPQAVDPAVNRNARKLLIRDVDNLTQFLGRYETQLKRTRYGQEIWDLYESGNLTLDTQLTGKPPRKKAVSHGQTMSLLEEIDWLEKETRRKREALGLPIRPARKPRPSAGPPPKPIPHGEPEPTASSKPKKRRRRRKRGAGSAPHEGSPQRSAEARPERTRSRKPSPPDPFDDLDALLIIDDS